jgi:hypothetical protein
MNGSFHRLLLADSPQTNLSKLKKADVAEHPEVFDHAGLLVNEPSSLGRSALQ